MTWQGLQTIQTTVIFTSLPRIIAFKKKKKKKSNKCNDLGSIKPRRQSPQSKHKHPHTAVMLSRQKLLIRAYYAKVNVFQLSLFFLSSFPKLTKIIIQLTHHPISAFLLATCPETLLNLTCNPIKSLSNSHLC